MLCSGLAAPMKLACTEAILERISGIFVYFLVFESLGEQNGRMISGESRVHRDL